MKRQMALAMAMTTALTGAVHAGTAWSAGAAGADVINRRLSPGELTHAASVPAIAVDPRDPDRVAVIWRTLSTNVAATSGEGREMRCYLSLSTNGGVRFSSQPLEWGTPDTPKCNAPDVDFDRDGKLLVAATLAGELPQNAPKDTPPPGRVAMRASADGGASWSPLVAPIATGMLDKFAPNPAVPEVAKKTPWDGARLYVDKADGTIIMSGGYPAPPEGAAHSQRFYVTSKDGGVSWAPIQAFGDLQWPQRWDGLIAAAHGRIAFAYMADHVPLTGVECLCVVFASGPHGGQVVHHFVAASKEMDTLVHYPPIAADEKRENVYALAMIRKDRHSPDVMVTGDSGTTWQTVSAATVDGTVVRASRPALSYAPDGTLVLMWRGYYQDGAYDVFVAAAPDGKAFRPAVRLSTARSIVPTAFAKDYAARGDFINVVAASADYVHAAWTDWRTGMGQVVYGRVPLAFLLDSH